MKKFLYTGLVACSVAFTSCGDKKTDADASSSTEASSSAAAPKALNPAEHFEAVTGDLINGKVSSLWNALPASYQNDASSLVHTFGEKVDAEVYDEALKTLTDANNLLKNKKDLIISMLNSQAPEDAQEDLKSVTENWDKITGLLDSVLTSDLKNTEGLKSLDIAQLCNTLEPQLKPLIDTAKAMNKDVDFSKVKAELVSEEGDSAVIKVTDPDGGVEEINLTRVEERWIPVEMSEEWAAGIAKAKEGLETVGSMKDAEKQQAIGMMKMAQGFIAQLNATETEEEFQQAIMSIAPMLGGF